MEVNFNSSVYTLGHVGRFQKKLEKRIRNQEREIERMCAFHYSHFVEAIEELSGIQATVLNFFAENRYFCIPGEKVKFWGFVRSFEPSRCRTGLASPF